MKVAVSSIGKGLDSFVDPRFGRCAYFLLIDTENMSFEVLENESAALGAGAGIQSAQRVISKGAGAVITGNCGPNAVEALAAANVEVFLGITGTVSEAVERYVNKNLTPDPKAHVTEFSGPTGKSKSRSPQQRIPGGGAVPGRGFGLGQGFKMGRGMG